MSTKSKSLKPGTEEASRWHLAATDEEAALSDLELALARWHESYARFARESLVSVGAAALSAEEIVMLHVIRMHDRPKTTSMVANLLNRTDTQNFHYSVRKLISHKLVMRASQKGVANKTAVLTVTASGRRLCDELAEFRRTALLESLRTLQGLPERLHSAARTISLLTALYDQAEREAMRPSAPLAKLPP